MFLPDSKFHITSKAFINAYTGVVWMFPAEKQLVCAVRQNFLYWNSSYKEKLSSTWLSNQTDKIVLTANQFAWYQAPLLKPLLYITCISVYWNACPKASICCYQNMDWNEIKVGPHISASNNNIQWYMVFFRSKWQRSIRRSMERWQNYHKLVYWT